MDTFLMCIRRLFGLPSTRCNDYIKPTHVDIVYNDRPEIEYANAGVETTMYFVPPISRGKVIKVLDVNNFIIASSLPNSPEQIYKFHIQLNKETKHIVNQVGGSVIESPNALNKLILGKIVRLENLTVNQTGNIVADVYIGYVHINHWVCNKTHIVSYHVNNDDWWDVLA